MPWFLGNAHNYYYFPMWFNFSLPLILIWSSIWKGLALWHAAKREDKIWFIIILVVNTIGILEIIYLAFIVKIFNEQNHIKKTSQSRAKRK